MTNIRQAMVDHAQAEFPREACGLVVIVHGKERYWPCRNISTDQDQFILDPADYVAAESAGEVVAVFHSHCNLPATPSEADRMACEASGVRWIILSLPFIVWAEFEPSGYQAPLVGRQHVWGVVDCWTLVQDWYQQEWGIALLGVPRWRDYWTTGTDLLNNNCEAAGFNNLKTGEAIEKGDVILMQTAGSVVPNHVALYIGDDMILHHAEGRLSSREVYGGWYKKHTVRVVRYADRPAFR